MITGPLFPLLQACTKKYIVLQGGGDAGKTTTALQHLAVCAIKTKGQIITVAGQDIPNLKKGALRTFKKYVASDPDVAKYIKSIHG